MADGDDDFTLVRKCFRDLRSIHGRTAQLVRQNPALAGVHDAMMAFKTALHDAAVALGRGDDL